MESVRYYPLVSYGDNEANLQAMTPTNNVKTVQERHSFWLMEMIPNYYRLCAAEKRSMNFVQTLSIRCPKCGKILRPITAIAAEHPFPLYTCERCSNRHDSRSMRETRKEKTK